MLESGAEDMACGDNAVLIIFLHCSLLTHCRPCALTEDYGAIVRGQWSIDPVAGDIGVMMKMLTGELSPTQAKVQCVAEMLQIS